MVKKESQEEYFGSMNDIEQFVAEEVVIDQAKGAGDSGKSSIPTT